MSRGAFLQGDDLQWLRETHLRGVVLPAVWKGFQFAVLQGNEDAPHAVNLYLKPKPGFGDDYLRIKFNCEPPVYCEYVEYSGLTDKPRRVYAPLERLL